MLFSLSASTANQLIIILPTLSPARLLQISAPPKANPAPGPSPTIPAAQTVAPDAPHSNAPGDAAPTVGGGPTTQPGPAATPSPAIVISIGQGSVFVDGE